MKTQKGEYVPHWWQTVARVERFWAGRILVLCELPENEEDLSPYKLRSDMRLLGGTWTPLFGWHGFGIAPQPKPKAASRALPKAAPKALPKAAPAVLPPRGRTPELIITGMHEPEPGDPEGDVRRRL